jgi:cell division protein FtsN
MAKDYAKNRPPPRARGGAPKRGGLPGWVGILVGLSIGLAIAAVVYIDRPSRKGEAGSLLPSAVGKDEPRKPPIVLPPKQPSRFGFYRELEKSEVLVPREDAKDSVKSGKPTTPAMKEIMGSPGQYLIQVGAYRTRDEAEKGRANLALLGMESRVEQGTSDQGETWYRVRIGPEKDLAKAQAIIDRLKTNDIEAMLIKVKAG